MLARRGQSIVEYTIIVGIVTVVLFYMGTGMKRGFQSMVKVTADQIGNQQNADQDFNDIAAGYMEASNTFVYEPKNKEITESGYIDVNGVEHYDMNISDNYNSWTLTNTITNAGFTPGAQ